MWIHSRSIEFDYGTKVMWEGNGTWLYGMVLDAYLSRSYRTIFLSPVSRRKTNCIDMRVPLGRLIHDTTTVW